MAASQAQPLIEYDTLPERLRLPEPERKGYWSDGACHWPDSRGCCHCTAAVGPIMLLHDPRPGHMTREIPLPEAKGGRYRRCHAMTGHHDTLCPSHKKQASKT